MKIDKELVEIGLEANSKEDVLRILGNRLVKAGFVKEGYIESVLSREKNFPTGLPTVPFGVAIPHTDGDMVHVSKIAFASLKKPVKFFAMGRNDELIDVKMVFYAGIKKSDRPVGYAAKTSRTFSKSGYGCKVSRS
ncbi:PTS sugar transporter subunit IIA [Planococcus shixiaomingii]|nr:PTS sugar transporter subunit IIA [Planococcus sp. N022]WKA56618.1 PTS sugar transporter subunit IIA [Planococcus sp. N022]